MLAARVLAAAARAGGRTSQKHLLTAMAFRLLTALAAIAAVSAAFAPACAPRSAAPAAARACRPLMDETIMQKALSGELEQEGAENVFMSELGWASYLDKNAGSSYNMNERPSKAGDGYFTPDVFSNPIEGAQRRSARAL